MPRGGAAAGADAATGAGAGASVGFGLSIWTFCGMMTGGGAIYGMPPGTTISCPFTSRPPWVRPFGPKAKVASRSCPTR